MRKIIWDFIFQKEYVDRIKSGKNFEGTTYTIKLSNLPFLLDMLICAIKRKCFISYIKYYFLGGKKKDDIRMKKIVDGLNKYFEDKNK